jgi:hypothetical protein
MAAEWLAAGVSTLLGEDENVAERLTGTYAFVAFPQSDAAGLRARPRGQDRSYCGSYVSFTMLEKDFVAVSFIATA